MDANSVNSVCYKACINVHTRRTKIKIPTIIAEKIEQKHLLDISTITETFVLFVCVIFHGLSMVIKHEKFL